MIEINNLLSSLLSEYIWPILYKYSRFQYTLQRGEKTWSFNDKNMQEELINRFVKIKSRVSSNYLLIIANLRTELEISIELVAI